MLGRDGELHQLGPRIHEQIDQGKMALGGRIDLVRPGVNAVQLSSGTAVLPYLTLRTTAVPVGVVPLQPAVVHVTVADASKAMWCNDRCRCRRPDLGDFGYAYAASYGVSGDGSVVVGEAWNASFEQRAFRWTVAGGLQDLGTLGGPYARAADVSADGQMIVGDSWDASGNNHAFRWTATSGMQDLGTFGGFDSGAYGVSADGSVVVGMAYPKAFRWTVTNGMEPIGTSGSPSQAFSVSQDGSVIVGRSTNGNAFRWTAAGGLQDLGTLGGVGSAAYDVSANGSVVVGDSSNASGMTRAFRWTASTGMQDLSSIYAGSIGSGSYLVYANAVSADGLHIVGYGYNRQNNRWLGYSTN